MRTLDPKAGVIGVYDHPAPEGGEVRSVPLYPNGGMLELGLAGARSLTRLRDRISDELEELLGL